MEGCDITSEYVEMMEPCQDAFSKDGYKVERKPVIAVQSLFKFVISFVDRISRYSVTRMDRTRMDRRYYLDRTHLLVPLYALICNI